MLVYSERIVRFVKQIQMAAKEILSREMGLKVFGERFYVGNASYPISICLYDNKKMLGYFDADFYEMGFHERLMRVKYDQLYDLIRHELAHYLTFIHWGQVQDHGGEFRSFCQKLGWGENVYKASFCLEEHESTECEENAILRKVQKLMALSTSTNSHEAELALIKSQQLLLKHNLEFVPGVDEEKIYLKRILKQKKEDTKMRAIAKILETFFVSTVYRRTDDFIVLEILGSLVNVEIAEYVADILKLELEKLWEHAKKNYALKGLVAKNSFFLGIARGYCQKIEALKRTYDQGMTTALMVIEKKLVAQQDLVYSRLSSRRSSHSHCQASSSLGEMLGRQLNINPALARAQGSSSSLYLTF